ncbi:hypothetical protein NM688_g3982 [Phlebia brevispora]|uniref:Uncharacterized protein n=1 Tax=Phlebia brevispora TaxID=194682 RepID=A0ACC1T460_9APHY|nr:hypothetical protein NM688_g3982 [Phlebia brevispora]
MPGLNKLPPFPEDIPTHPLLVIDYQLLKEGNEDEINRLWEAATKLGFWYLKNHGADREVDEMFEMGEETMKLPLAEKMKFSQGEEGASFGYKVAGSYAVDEKGTQDTVEFINISKDDALAWPNKVHREYPSTVNSRMESTIKPFVQKAVEVNGLLIDILNDKLGLPKGTLAAKHKLLEPSGSEARCIKNPPRPGGVDDAQTALGAHTDFGSLSFLHNRLGGLQVLPPGSHSWYYVKPLPGHAVCNVGDALAVFSGGILHSNLHRIVTAPKEQAKYERWSSAFFTRPANHVELTPLTDESAMIAEAVRHSPDPNRFRTGQTSAEWFARRVKYQRIKHWTVDRRAGQPAEVQSNIHRHKPLQFDKINMGLLVALVYTALTNSSALLTCLNRLNKLPPFPEDIPTHPLLVIDYQLLKEGDEAEISRLWDAATTIGFWYLKNHGADQEVDGMFEMGEKTMSLPLDEKMKFEWGDEGGTFGYKASGSNAVDEKGTRDTVEFINISKDDALAWPNKVHRDYPSTVNARMENTIKPFVQKSVVINGLIIDILNDKLGLPKGTFAAKHKLLEHCRSDARCIKNPPRPGGIDDARTALGAHTDFGSLSFLHNRLGGLQVMPPGSQSCPFSHQPLPGHAICNIGDALSVFSGGILRSNVHRIVTAPKEQAKYDRWSTGFFTRPANYVELVALTDESPMIAEAVKNAPDPSKFRTGQTSEEWLARRVKYQRIKNRTGPESWHASKGTEHSEPDQAVSV